jgi:hypothetical protein
MPALAEFAALARPQTVAEPGTARTLSRRWGSAGRAKAAQVAGSGRSSCSLLLRAADSLDVLDRQDGVLQSARMGFASQLRHANLWAVDQTAEKRL